jgi:glycosyltransferase involved in cell wall biosynthesis
VTSDVNGLKEIAGDAALRVDATRPEAIAAALTRVLTDPALHVHLSREGLTRARQFSWEQCARRTLDILESLTE